jgi:tetratricopeptide (TPR) repeat protein
VVSYGKAASIEPTHAAAWNARGNGLHMLKRYEEAVVSYDRALAIDANIEAAWYNRGNGLCLLHRYHEAVASYDRALDINANDATIWYNRGNALCELNKYQEALESYDRACMIDGNHAKTWNNRGVALLHLSLYEEAINSCTKAVALDSKEPEYQRNFAEVHALLGHNLNALAAIEAYLTYRPADHKAWDTKGSILSRLGRHREALVAYERAALIDQSNALYHYNGGIALQKLRKKQEAADRFRFALQDNKAFEKAADALEHLEDEQPSWWDWWFRESRVRASVGVFLATLLITYIMLPLFSGEFILVGDIGLNIGRSLWYYIFPVSAIVLLLVLPAVLRWGKAATGPGIVLSRQEPNLAPLDIVTSADEEDHPVEVKR